MRLRPTSLALIAAIAALCAGCHTNTVDSAAFKSALNNYYSSRQECLWSQPIKFPVQADASHQDQTEQFDALTDAGLLTRTSGEKQRFLIGSKRVNDYDISDKGRSYWTPDPAQPGYGNFCLGSPTVKSVDSYVPNNDPSASQFTVTYHYAISLPNWAAASEIGTAFPRAALDSQGQEATAVLVKSQNGWQVQNVNAPNQPGN
jgi:hypothetical protein